MSLEKPSFLTCAMLSNSSCLFSSASALTSDLPTPVCLERNVSPCSSIHFITWKNNSKQTNDIELHICTILHTRPIRLKTKANRDMVARVFLRFRCISSLHFELLLAPCDISLVLIGYCDSFGFGSMTLDPKAL